MKKSILMVLSIALLISCKKESSDTEKKIDPADIAKAEQMNKIVSGKHWKLASFTSDKPIDYDDTDQVVDAKTDLWEYVSLWLKDDYTWYKTRTEIEIQQHDSKIPTDGAEVLHRSYAIGADEKGVYMDFLNFQYEKLRYRVESFEETSFVITVPFKDGKANLKSKFEQEP